MSDRPNNQNLGKDFLLLWADTPLPKAVSPLIAQVVSTPPTGGGGGGSSPSLADMLSWCLMPPLVRAAKHMTGSGSNSYHIIDTDATYPVGYPAGTFFWMKNVAGNPWDIERYDLNYISHWITEDGDPVDQAACVAAGSPGGCWGYANAYKRFFTPVRMLPRFFDINGSPVTIDTPGPNQFARTTNCESSFATISLGDVRAITFPPVKMTWAGSIDTGGGADPLTGPVVDNVNGVPTIQNDYFYGGNLASSSFIDKESTFYVQGFGRVAWAYYKKISGVWELQQMTINNVLANGVTVPNFPCGAGKPWWV